MKACGGESATIVGRHVLNTPEITVGGSKKAALPMLAASAASGYRIHLANLPASGEVQAMAGLIRACGWTVTADGGHTTVDPESVREEIPEADFSAAARIHDSHLLAPALLAAYGRAELPHARSGGLLDRSTELRSKVYESFGDQFVSHENGYHITASGRMPPLVTIPLPYRSRGATITALLRAASEGQTGVVINNPDTSAETMAVFNALTSLAWEGRWSPDRLMLIPREPDTRPAPWTVPGDTTEAAILACALMATGGSGDIFGAPGRGLRVFCEAVNMVGLYAELDADRLYIRPSLRARERRWTGINVRAGLEPRALDPDFEPLLLALALTCAGRHTFQDEVNPGRHGILIPHLAALGAQINLPGPGIATFNGPQHLVGATLTARGPRSGAALIIAALAARGRSTITGLEHVRRDFADLPEKLTSLGAALTATR